MEAFLIYLIKSSGIILLFLLCYWFFLNRETFHTGKRFFLLTGLIVALILPLITYTKTIWIDTTSLVSPMTASMGHAPIEEVPKIDWTQLLFLAYAIGVLIGIARLAVQLLSLRKVFRNSDTVQKGKIKLLEASSPTQPFSFFNRVVYHPESRSKDEFEVILAHEKIHADQYHSIDILLMHLFTIFQWCNPVIYLYKFYLKENLEFLADAKTLSDEVQKADYQYLLLKNTVDENHFPFVNPFFNSSVLPTFSGIKLPFGRPSGQVKKRIVMLNKTKSKKRNLFKLGIIIPMLLIFVLVFNARTEAKLKYAVTQSGFLKNGHPKLYFISKDVTDEGLRQLADQIEKEGGKLTIENLKRNSLGHIISVSVTYKVNEGGYVTGNYDTEDEIDSIYFGTNEKGGLFITSEEAQIEELQKAFLYQEEQMRKIKPENTYSIGKNTSDAALKEIKSNIEKKGGKFSYTHKRNSNGAIIDLEFEIKFKGTGNFKSTPEFERCYFGTFEGGGIFLADDEHAFNKLKLKNIQTGQGQGSNIKTNGADKFNEVAYDKEKSGDFPYLTTSFNYPYSGKLYLVNGVEVPAHTLYTVSPEFIESMNISKGEQAVLIYGERAKNGVIAIQTKGSLYPSPNDLQPAMPFFGFDTNSNSIKTSQPKPIDSLKVSYGARANSNEIEASSEDSPWKVSAGLSPKNQDKMSASELWTYYRKQQGKNAQQDLEGVLILVEGKEMSKKEFDKIPANEIESISVLTGEAAGEKNGKKGKRSVIEVSLKKYDITIGGANQSPLIIIDGIESSNEEMQNLNRDKIKSVNVLKNKQAIKKYGKKATDGAVEIITKKNKF